MDRLKYNRLIIAKISDYLEEYPDIRFGQALIALNVLKVETTIFKDNVGDDAVNFEYQAINSSSVFNDEPKDILKRMKDV